MAEVILLSDSSDASSERGTAPTSTATSPAASPAVQRGRAQSVGYTNAVEAALAMAAAFETHEPNSKKKEKKKIIKKTRRVKPAPPLLYKKGKKPRTNQPQSTAEQRQTVAGVKSREKQRPVKTSRARAPSSSGSSSSSSSCLSSDSDSSSSSRYKSRRRQQHRTSDASRRPTSRNPPAEKSRRRLFHEEQMRRKRARSQTPKPVEVVDLLSSSSSSLSDSATSGWALSSSVSSLTSSDDESSISSGKGGKKCLVLNDRVLGKRSAQSASSKVADIVTVALREGKRKRVLPHMRRKSSGCIQTRGRLPEHQSTKKTINSKKPVMNGTMRRGAALKPEVAAQSSALSTPRTSSSSSSESSPASSPRPLPSRKSAATLSAGVRALPAPLPRPLPSRKSAVTSITSRVRDGDTDAFGRYRCRKSAPASAVSLASVNSVSPSPVRPTSATSVPSPSPRKKRRVTSNTYFDADRVALNDLQAQERELAWIRSHRKQTHAQSLAPKPADQKKKKTEPEVINVEDHSDANSVAFAEDSQMQNRHLGAVKVEVKPSAAGPRFTSALLHPTSYRGVYLERAPTNILQLHIAPFDSRCDQPLTFYDETDTLAPQCAIRESFGRPTQCISSVFPGESAKPQSDVTRAVGALVAAHLPVIRSCHKRKVQAILAEARLKISAYRSALMKHRRALCEQHVTVRVLPREAAEKHTAKQLKAAQHTCSLNAGSISFRIGRGDGFVREKSVSSLIQINRIEEVQPLRKYTTSIGVRANYRAEDDPILRYTAITRPSSGNGGDETARKYALRIGNVADDDVTEYVLRLVVGRLGDSEQVFQALKSELDFPQAYTAYSELKKLHDSRQRANTRIDQIEKLMWNAEAKVLGPDVAAIVNLMEHASLSKSSRAKVLSRRLQPPISSLESSLVDSLVDDATAGMAALGLRGTDSYPDLVDIYCSSFCRMCYKYACHEHGGDHPLPARRVDPVYPRILSAAPGAQAVGRVDEVNLPEDEVVCLGTDPTVEKEIASGVGPLGNAQCGASTLSAVTTQSASSIGRDVDVSDDSEQQRKQKVLADPSEFVDDSHVSLIAIKPRPFLSKGSVCSKLCWKSGDRGGNDQQVPMSAAELGVVRKLRETMGDNSCLLAAVIGSLSCINLHDLIKNEQVNGERIMSDGGPSRRPRSWKHGRRSDGSNHELLQRTRNQRLQDRGTENHEYKPCMHEGMCDSTGCSCMKRDHMCEKACACSRDCPNRFEGCVRARSVSNQQIASAPVMCGNMNVTRGKHKRLGMSFSAIHGFGMYTREAITANEYVYEHTGAMLSQDEAERRGLVYDKMEMSYLFDLNEDAVLDALRDGNKSKFINHDGETPNCTAKVLSVCGVHHISIWALRDIAIGEELVFDYGYQRSVGPDWSQHRSTSKDTS
ncbi:hypothetical protein PF010_g17621 [Phytophthora fragariae]|uniref:SET domain-containing protein n=1 Tax=Phytophthora fragariae TaxID=53985 RepID=A0A6A3JJ49_9STRA|nr:hypothetical protein PF003_g20521 [Phytophthora fragariae]KAE8930049.1 hypothetical protein PF009_g19850 [Phytophthora fragariae]KAE8993657.1 hypothetical protein PF011_g17046 [Phytophthora fragariae]KAE9093090.1 hypothetical protein PF010_g17621 [Phytophthora fragariae]KAE9124464.1 hypothetical protein PF006_g17183 [Phytophthora fragariae]